MQLRTASRQQSTCRQELEELRGAVFFHVFDISSSFQADDIWALFAVVKGEPVIPLYDHQSRLAAERAAKSNPQRAELIISCPQHRLQRLTYC